VDRDALDNVVFAAKTLKKLRFSQWHDFIMGSDAIRFCLTFAINKILFHKIQLFLTCATSGSKKVMKANALNGFGMKTSVTSPNFEK
jgi:hypothetical protein